MTFEKSHRKVKIKTTGLAHNFIILGNCWNHDRRSMSNGSMSYGDPVYGTMWEKVQKRSRSKQQVLYIIRSCTSQVLYIIILGNFWKWYHNQRSMSSRSMSYGVHKVTPFMAQCGKILSFVWPCKRSRKGLVHNFIILADCWNHDQRSKWKGSMSCGVHKKVFWTHTCMQGQSVLQSAYWCTPGAGLKLALARWPESSNFQVGPVTFPSYWTASLVWLLSAADFRYFHFWATIAAFSIKYPKYSAQKTPCYHAWYALYSHNWNELLLDTKLKHFQIINLELCFKNRNPLNNLDDRVTFSYQYAWNDTWYSNISWSEVSSVGNHGDWLLARFVKNLAPWPPKKRSAIFGWNTISICINLVYIWWIYEIRDVLIDIIF